MLNADLKRRTAKRAPLVRFFVYCEGQNTEPGYFLALNKKIGRDQIRVESIATGDPANILNAAKKKKAEIVAEKGDVGADDQVWAVFDEDTRPNFMKAISDFEAAGIPVAASNSCFELWLIAHHANEFALGDQKKLQGRLRTLDKTYNSQRKTMDFDALVEHLHTAEKRAERVAAAAIKSGSEYGRGTTYVFKLTQAIFAAAARFKGN
jgi:hypothetical protein